VEVLRYTGHPIADVGVATICAFCEKDDPATINAEDLVDVADYIDREYFSGKLTSYLSVVIPNSKPYQAAITPKLATKFQHDYRTEVLLKFKSGNNHSLDNSCAYCGERAVDFFYRHHIPMITGVDVLNFFPAGSGGLPLCGSCLLAIQVFMLGARRCFGKALAVHCPDDPRLTLDFARQFLQDNQKLMLLAQRTGEKYEDAKWPRTIVIDQLLKISARNQSTDDPRPSLTVYHLTNSGQGPDIDVYELPSETVSFVAKAVRATTADAWNKIVSRAWELPAEKRKAKSKSNSDASSTTAPQVGVNRNFLYEDLFTLPDYASRFVRTYLLRRSWRAAQQATDPRAAYQVARELDLISWPLTYLFLREVLGMDETRIVAIQTFADRLAEHIRTKNDRRLFRNLCMTDNYAGFRNGLIKASVARVKADQPPLTSFDEFVLVFETPDAWPRIDRRLAIDLVLIRLFEQLYQKGWFKEQADVIEEIEDTLESKVEGEESAQA
jgi:CRISPR-associated protein Cst1